jgi:hypothetical protein
LQAAPRLRFAGQITGCEGYVESAAIGGLAGRFAAAERLGETLSVPPPTTAHGALLGHITGGHVETIDAGPHSFQPMNVNFGLFPPLARVPNKGPDGERLRGPGQIRRQETRLDPTRVGRPRPLDRRRPVASGRMMVVRADARATLEPDNDAPAELAGRWRRSVVLKRDVFSIVERGTFAGPNGSADAVVRRIDDVPWWSRPIARHFLKREARALAAIGASKIAPPLLFSGRRVLVRRLHRRRAAAYRAARWRHWLFPLRICGAAQAACSRLYPQ